MSICRAWLRKTSNVLTLWTSIEPICLQVPYKLFGVNSWIMQITDKQSPWSICHHTGSQCSIKYIVSIQIIPGSIYDCGKHIVRYHVFKSLSGWFPKLDALKVYHKYYINGRISGDTYALCGLQSHPYTASGCWYLITKLPSKFLITLQW